MSFLLFFRIPLRIACKVNLVVINLAYLRCHCYFSYFISWDYIYKWSCLKCFIFFILVKCVESFHHTGLKTKNDQIKTQKYINHNDQCRHWTFCIYTPAESYIILIKFNLPLLLPSEGLERDYFYALYV